MKNIFFIFYCISLKLITCFEFSRPFFQQNSWSTIEAFHNTGSLKGYFTYFDMINILTNINANFPDLISNYMPIGNTTNNNSMYAISFCSKISRLKQNGDDISQLHLPTILFTGLLHGDEFISINMCIYIMNKLIYGYVNKDPAYTYLLENREIWFIPMINIDTLRAVEINYQSTKKILFLKKNRRLDNLTNVNACGAGTGVDLNCNFPFHYNTSDCSNDPCDAFYRGTSALSEKETKTLDNFLQQQIFNVAVNYFSPYNFLLNPYNYMSSITTWKLYNYFYENFQNEGSFPPEFQFGQSFQFLNQSYDGDISDYMLNNYKIMAVDYYIGDNDDSSDIFLPNTSSIIGILSQNYPAAYYFIGKSGDFLKFLFNTQMICTEDINECSIAGLDTNKYYYEASLINAGFISSVQNTEIIVSFTSPDIYFVDRAFIKITSNNSTELSVSSKIYDNGTYYYSCIYKQTIPANTTYTVVIIIKKNPNNDQQANYATYPQKIILSLGGYYPNNFNPYISMLTNINFDLYNLKPEVTDDFHVRFESYVILIIFCVIAFIFLISFIWIKSSEILKRNKVAFQPLAKKKPEDGSTGGKEVEMQMMVHEKESTS